MDGTADKEFYLELIQQIVSDQRRLMGDKVALIQARKTPLKIDADGAVTDFYGEGKTVLDVLVSQYEEVWGRAVADRKIRESIRGMVPEDRMEQLPERIRPDREGDEVETSGGFLGLWNRLACVA